MSVRRRIASLGGDAEGARLERIRASKRFVDGQFRNTAAVGAGLIPLGVLGYESLQSGVFPTFEFTWEFSNYSDALADYDQLQIKLGIGQAGGRTRRGTGCTCCAVLTEPR